MDAEPVRRRYELDWLRVLAFVGVFFYHCARFFNSADWEVKNADTSALADVLTGVFELCGMPLIFAVSGACIFFALRPKGELCFLGNRARRLLVPLALGILVLGPPQVYLKRLTHNEFQGSFPEFLPLYFGGYFAWTGVHLWYLEYLFLFTLILMPLFVWLKRPSGRRAVTALSRFSVSPGAIFLWAVPFALLSILVDPFGLRGPTLSEAILRLVMYPLFLIYGFLVFADDDLQRAIIRQRRPALMLALVLSPAPALVSLAIGGLGWELGPLTFVLLMALAGLLVWSYILAFFGYGMRYWNVNRPLLAYANEAVLPFYILHQPVILLIGYFVTQLALPIGVKYLVIAPLAFGVTVGLYHSVVRHWNPVRRVFGLKVHQLEHQQRRARTGPLPNCQSRTMVRRVRHRPRTAPASAGIIEADGESVDELKALY